MELERVWFDLFAEAVEASKWLGEEVTEVFRSGREEWAADLTGLIPKQGLGRIDRDSPWLAPMISHTP